MMRTLLNASLGLALLLFSGSAVAAPFNPFLDFRDPMFAPPSGVASHTVGVYGGYSITFEALEMSSLSSAGTLYWDSDDGFGISDLSYENDEIEDMEVLRITLSHTPYVERFLISDLFLEKSYAETGSYSVDGGSTWTQFFATGQHANGMVALPIYAPVNSILFNAPGANGKGHHEFSVAGADARWNRGGPSMERAMPEPSAALLFAAGLLLLDRHQRRRKRA